MPTSSCRRSTAGRPDPQGEPRPAAQVNRTSRSSARKVLHQWATLGEFDFVNVVEAPDVATVAKVSIALGARGSTRIETLPALDDRRVPADDRL